MLQNKLVVVFGGSGFVGRHVVRALVKRGLRVRVACRRPDLAGHLQPLGNVGQIHAVQANVRYEASVRAAVQGADCVINLIGILYESGKQRFDVVQTEGARLIAQAARDAGVPQFIQMSALGVDAADADYAASKRAGEEAVRAVYPDAIIFRPSIIFGPEDNFFNQFAALARIAPALPLIGGGQTRFQPVFVGDVAEAIARAIDGQAKSGQTYELGGAEIKTFKQILEYILEITGRSRLLIPVPWAVADLKAFFLQLLPKPLLTRDQVKMLRTDNVVSAEALKKGLTLSGLGITPTTIEAVVPQYLWRFRAAGEFSPDKAA